MKVLISRFFIVMAIMLPMLVLTGCESEDYIEDFYPIELPVDITDSDGNNLLDPGVEGNIVGESMTIEYKGEIFDVRWEPYAPAQKGSRAYLASFYGAKHCPLDCSSPASADNPWILRIGELSGGDDYDVTMPLRYKGRMFNIRVVNKVKYTWGKTDVDTKVYLNGDKCKKNRVHIVLR